MEKIKRFIDINVPVTACTLRCHYCYITQHKLFEGKLPTFEYSPSHVRKALSKERMGGTCLINLCGNGETLLVAKLCDYIKEFLEEGHYVMVVTNATVTKQINRLSELPPSLTKRLFFKFSYHYMELKKRDLLPTFFSNVNKVAAAGCSFTLEVTPSDELIPYIGELKEEAIKNCGAIPHITVARDERDPQKLPILTSLPQEEYIKVWSEFKSMMFDYKMTIFGKKRREFCYAGDWSFYLNLVTGDMTQCYKSYLKQNIFQDIDKPICFLPVGCHCGEHHCYNGHAWLTLGDIPELEAPYYAELRNRVREDGSEWLQPDMKSFMTTKLYETNKEYGSLKKMKVNAEVSILKLRNKAISGMKRLTK